MQKSISEPRQKNLKADDLQQLKDTPGAISVMLGHYLGLTKTGPLNIRKTLTCLLSLGFYQEIQTTCQNLA